MNGRAVLADGAPDGFLHKNYEIEKYKNFLIKSGRGLRNSLRTVSLVPPARYS